MDIGPAPIRTITARPLSIVCEKVFREISRPSRRPGTAPSEKDFPRRRDRILHHGNGIHSEYLEIQPGNFRLEMVFNCQTLGPEVLVLEEAEGSSFSLKRRTGEKGEMRVRVGKDIGPARLRNLADSIVAEFLVHPDQELRQMAREYVNLVRAGGNPIEVKMTEKICRTSRDLFEAWDSLPQGRVTIVPIFGGAQLTLANRYSLRDYSFPHGVVVLRADRSAEGVRF